MWRAQVTGQGGAGQVTNKVTSKRKPLNVVKESIDSVEKQRIVFHDAEDQRPTTMDYQHHRYAQDIPTPNLDAGNLYRNRNACS